MPCSDVAPLSEQPELHSHRFQDGIDASENDIGAAERGALILYKCDDLGVAVRLDFE